MEKKIVCIIQARMGSTRLPGKVLKKVAGKPLLQYTIENLRNSNLIDKIILATSILKRDDLLEKFAENIGVELFRGSEEDVLSRYYLAAKRSNADIVVRITGDCPLIDYNITDRVIRLFLKNEVDFAANNIVRTFPRGVDTSVFSFEALERAHKNAEKPSEREHVIPYIRITNRERFKLINYEAEGKLRRPDIRITVDEEEDFFLIKEIINRIEDRPITLGKVIDLLNYNPGLLEINKNIEQKKVDFSAD